jgi:hypothetical protein
LAGYSGTPLPKKLGIKEGFQIAFIEAPAGFSSTLGELPPGVVEVGPRGKGPLDLVVLFVKSLAELNKAFPNQKDRLAPAGMLWIGWPKKSSGVVTDLTENVIRDTGLALGLVDTKVCAIDDMWSALKFVFRLKDRPSRV